MRGGARTLGIPEQARPAHASLLAAIHEAGGAPCRTNPERWTSDNAAERDTAAAACLDCLALVACLHYADAAAETHGVWGGIDRNLMLGRRRKDAA